MNILRRASTTRIIIAGALIVLAAGAASIALASRSAGPTPPKRSLASAIHHALAGPRVAGVTARIRFSNHLLASGVAPGLEPAAALGRDRPALGGGRQGSARAPGG